VTRLSAHISLSISSREQEQSNRSNEAIFHDYDEFVFLFQRPCN